MLAEKKERVSRMKKSLLTLMALMMSAQQSLALNIDKAMDTYVAPVTDKIASFIFLPISLHDLI